MKIISASIWLVCALASSVAYGQIPTDQPSTIIQLGAPSVPNGHVQLPPRDSLRLLPPTPEFPTARWFKNNVQIANSTQGALDLGVVNEAIAGTYSYRLPLFTIVLGNSVEVTVAPLGGNPRFINYSSRIRLRAGDDVQIAGLVVSGRKQVFVRAVGGSTLQAFGVQNTVSKPRITIYRGDGTLWRFTHLTVVYPPASFNTMFAASGAFPMVVTEINHFTNVEFGGLEPGAYTIHVSDDSKAGGEVLVEVYELVTQPPL